MEEGYGDVVVRIADHTTGYRAITCQVPAVKNVAGSFQNNVSCVSYLAFSVGEMAVHRDEESHSVFASTTSFSDPPDFSSQLCSTDYGGTLRSTLSLERMHILCKQDLGTFFNLTGVCQS